MTLEFLGDCKIYTGCPVFPLIYDWKKGLNHVIGIFFPFPVLRCALRALNFAILRGFTWILGGLHSHPCNFPFTWKCISFRLSCCTSIPGFFPLWYYCHTVIFFFVLFFCTYTCKNISTLLLLWEVTVVDMRFFIIDLNIFLLFLFLIRF